MADAQAKQKATPVAEIKESSEFYDLLKQDFKPTTDTRREAIEQAVSELARQALARSEEEGMPDDLLELIETMISTIDARLTEQVNLILHHEDFREMEGAWRGLAHLVNNTETDEMLKIKVFNISKTELRNTLKRYTGVKWDQSPIFKKIYEEEYGQFGGAPFGALVGDYYFNHTAPDVQLLSQISQIAAAAHSPFISGLDPAAMQLGSWQELSKPRDLAKIFSDVEYAPWKSLRDADDSRYIGLALPRFLARLPYGEKSEPVDEFAFEEDTASPPEPDDAPAEAAQAGEEKIVFEMDHNKYIWANSAYAMATNITRAFKLWGWCSRIRGIESGGALENLPCHTFPTDDGGTNQKCPTEIAISDRREKELADLGFMPLLHKKNTDFAAFIGAQSLQRPAEYEGEDGAYATSNAKLSANLPYLFASCRFAHYLKQLARDKIGSYKERGDMEIWLNGSIQNYVEASPETATEGDRARKPLAAARVEVKEVEGSPGYYDSVFYLRPHYQLEGLKVSLRLVSRVPTG